MELRRFREAKVRPSAGRSQNHITALLLELTRVQIELKRRRALCTDLRDRLSCDPDSVELIQSLREEILTPVLDEVFRSERIQLGAAVAPECLLARRRIQRVHGLRRDWETLLHHEVVLSLASLAVQRAIQRVIESDRG